MQWFTNEHVRQLSAPFFNMDYTSNVCGHVHCRDVLYSWAFSWRICYRCQTSDCVFDLTGTSCIIEAIWKVIDIYSPAIPVMEMVTAVKRNVHWKCINKRHFWREKFNQETRYGHFHFSSTALLVFLNGRMFLKCLKLISAWLYSCIHLPTWIIKWCSFIISKEASKLNWGMERQRNGLP
jgi:hypothetical protein